DKLIDLGADLLKKTVLAIEKGDYQEKPQTNFGEIELKHAPKIFKEDCQIDWDNNNDAVYNLIRGLSPYPTAFTEFMNKGLKVFKAEKEQSHPDIPAGEFK